MGGQLRIDVLGTTLADVLAKVAALTGVTIDLPEAAKDERLPVVQLGPGPAREVRHTRPGSAGERGRGGNPLGSNACANAAGRVRAPGAGQSRSTRATGATQCHQTGRTESPAVIGPAKHQPTVAADVPATGADDEAGAPGRAHGPTGTDHNGPAVGDSEEVETGTETVLRSVPSL